MLACIPGHQAFLFLHILKLFLGPGIYPSLLSIYASVSKDSGSLSSLLQTVAEATVNRIDASWGLKRERTGFWSFPGLSAVLVFLASLAVPSGDLSRFKDSE